MRQIEAAVTAEGNFQDILARICDLWLCVFFQRYRRTFVATFSIGTTVAVFQVIHIFHGHELFPFEDMHARFDSSIYRQFNRKDSTMSHRDAVLYAVAIVVLTGINAILVNQFFVLAMHNGMKVRVSVCSIIYRKSLRLSQTALGQTAPGKVVNLLSNDVNRFDIVSLFLNAMWTAPLLALISGYLLWVEVGWAGMIGIAVVFVVVPIQSKFARNR